MFLLKKILGNLMMPLSFSLLLLLLGLMLLWFSHQQSKKQLWGKLLISLGTVLLLISSLPYTSQLLTVSLERNHPPLFTAPTDLEYVIVLGGRHRNDPYLPPRYQLNSASYYRVMEGIRLMQANPGATLLLSGYGGSEPISNAQAASIVARQYGISAKQIRLVETPKDTAQEAALIAPIIKQHKSALVTSASHMPRALSLFHAQGANPLPAPTLFLGKEPQNALFMYEQLPRADNLGGSTAAWHEIFGSLWQKIRKKTADVF